MISESATLFGGAVWLLLIASSVWAKYRFAEFDRLPRQFDASLKPTAYSPTWLMVWLTPVIFVAINGFIFALSIFVPAEYLVGDPDAGVIGASLTLIGSQALILWLLASWARKQS